jgi:hypothetical protein
MYRNAVITTLASAIFIFANQFASGAALMGTGTMRCGEWTRLRMFSDKQAGHIKELASLHEVEAWIDGFVSGANVAGTESDWADFLSSRPKSDALYAVVDTYRRRDGIDRVADAATDMVKELKKRVAR